MACKKSPKRRRRMSKGQRHHAHGAPKHRQKRGRAATQSHRTNPDEPRRPKGLRPVAASRCTAPTHGPGITPKRKEPKAQELHLRITYKCNQCGGRLEYEGQFCAKKVTVDYYPYWRNCTGQAIKHESWA